jgi:hypothetical protein
MVDKNIFFQQFQINYFDYKQKSLEYLLENHSKLGFENQIIGYSEKDYATAIRSDIRQTYFQAIETVFELFFALLPDENGEISDKIIEKLTLSDLPYSKISKIKETENSLDYLDKINVYYPDKSKSTLWEFIFYFGYWGKTEWKKEMSQSISAIKYTLRQLANEFSDRAEYNSYKHGLRIIPALKTFKVLNAQTNEELTSWDLENSMTFFSFDKKTKESIFTTKNFDSERDIRMTSICSNLIWCMIKSKAVAFNKSKIDENKKIEVLFFGKKEVDEAMETKVKIQNLKYSTKPN